MINKLCRKRGNGIIKCLVVNVIIFGAISIYLTWNKWGYSYIWGPNLDKLIPEVDDFFWGILQREELSTSANSANLSESFKPDEIYSKQPVVPKRQEQRRKSDRNRSIEHQGSDSAVINEEPVLPFCPQKPPKLKGWLDLPDFYKNDPLTLQQLADKFPNLRYVSISGFVIDK